VTRPKKGSPPDPAVPPRSSDLTDDDRDAAERAFTDGVLARGEAAPAPAPAPAAVPDDELPPGATHEVVDDDGGEGKTTVRRRRYSAF
jgi:hypothetical protein